MKLTHIAQGLTLLLVIVTVWLAWQANEESKKANAKMDRLTAQATSMGSFSQAAFEQGSLLPPVAAPAPAAPEPESPPASASFSPGIPVVNPAPPAVSEPTGAELARASLPAPAPTGLAPGELTPLQKRVKDAPSLGKVQDFVAEHGFVTFQVVADSGLKPGMQFDLRREASVVGRIKIDIIEGTDVIANLDPKSLPAGVTVQKGDEIISVIPTPTAAAPAP